jgi:hypothetical protein
MFLCRPFWLVFSHVLAIRNNETVEGTPIGFGFQRIFMEKLPHLLEMANDYLYDLGQT